MAVKIGYQKVYRDPLGYPGWRSKGLPVGSSPAGLAQTGPKEAAPGSLVSWAFVWTLLGVFAGGMALNLTPCVYPLIPITVSYFGGRTRKGRRELIGHGVCYIGGLAFINSILGVIAALTGSLLGALLQNPLVIAFIAAVLVFLAASLFGFWELRLPSGLTRTASKTHAGYFGSIFMGLTLGIVAAPCIGPFVLGLLTWVASLGKPHLGFLIFFTLSVGLGLPLFFLAIFSGQVEKLPRSGEWVLWVRKLMGWVLLAMAAYFIRPILPKTLSIFLLAGAALAAAIHLGWVDRTKASFRAFGLFQAGVRVMGLVTATLLLGSWFMWGPGINWQPYSDERLEDA